MKLDYKYSNFLIFLYNVSYFLNNLEDFIYKYEDDGGNKIKEELNFNV